MIRESPHRSKKGRAVALAVFALFAFAAFSQTRQGTTADAYATGQQRRARAARPAAAPRAAEFSHSTPAHRRACDSCHKFPSANWQEARAGEEAFPDVTQYPGHASCLACHRRQFYSSARPSPPICAVCHQSAVPRLVTLHPFPTLADRFDKSPKARTYAPDFLVSFPHDKHLAMLGALGGGDEGAGGVRFVRASYGAPPAAARAQEDAAKANEVCSTCHQTYMPQGDSDEEYVTKPPADLAEGTFWLKRGTFKTSPRGHSACFSCHTADAGISPAPSDCALCHKLPPEGADMPSDFDPAVAARMGVTDPLTLRLWAGRQAGAYRHEWFSHAEMKCADCHKVEEMDTADPRTKRVPILSCGGGGSGCHITTTDDEGGALNLAIAMKQENPSSTCTKCHVILGARPVPASHSSALSAIRK